MTQETQQPSIRQRLKNVAEKQERARQFIDAKQLKQASLLMSECDSEIESLTEDAKNVKVTE